MEQLRADIRLALRGLLRARGFTSAVVSMLAFAIMLETVALAVVNAYVVRSVPYPEANRLYNVAYARPGEDSPREMQELDWASVSDVIEHPIAWDLDVFYLIGGGHTEAAPGAWVTRGFMQGLGIRPLFGRTFAPDEFDRGAPQVALISHSLWQRRFQGDSAVLGRRFDAYVSDRPDDPEVFTIVGVLPPRFWHLNSYTDVLTPLRARTYPYLVRLREGVTPDYAGQRITQLVKQGAAGVPPDLDVQLRSFQAEYTRSLRPLLLAIATAITLVLLIACANVTLLALIRGVRRQGEVAIRTALGAGRMHVARMLATESVLLATMAAVTGTILAWWLLRALAPTIQRQLGRTVPGGATALSVDLMVLAAIAGLSILIALVLTVTGLLVSSRRSSFSLLRRSARIGAEGARGRRLRLTLVGLEVAGSLALLTGCGLTVRTVTRMLDTDLGLNTHRVIIGTLALRERSYPDADAQVIVYERLLRDLAETLPDVRTVALGSPSPLTEFDPQPVSADPDAGASYAGVRTITPDYFRVLGIELIQGRAFTAQDRASSEPVAIISESTARRLWPDASPLGRRLRISERAVVMRDAVTPARRVIGVVRDVRNAPTDPEPADVYVPFLQVPGRFASFVLQTSGAPAERSIELRRLLSGIDPEIAISSLHVLSDVADAQLERPRFLATAFSGFGLFAVLLAIGGIYGVTAYTVRQREHEVAIRMAVGADARSIIGLFLHEGAAVLACGVLAGLFGAVALGRLLESQLYGVATIDLLTLIASTCILGAACVVALWWPARQATATDPARALRAE